MITRRTFIQANALALAFVRRVLAASHDQFWTFKDPSDWTESESKRILTRSPWAKEASVDFKMGQDMSGGPGGDGPRGGGPSGGGPPGGGPPGGGPGGPPGGGMGGGPGGGMDEMHALIRWESALPVCAALKKPLAEANPSYLISVTGLPMRQPGLDRGNHDAGSQMREMMMKSTSLQRKGKDPLLPEIVAIVEAPEGLSFLVSFHRAGNNIVVEDKEVTFNMKMGPISLKAKFVLKEMIFRNQLAL
jgi:hypothetical protein